MTDIERVEKESYRKRKYILCLTFLTLVLSCLFTISIDSAKAEEDYDYGGDGWEYYDEKGIWYKQIDGTDYNAILKEVENQRLILGRLDAIFSSEEITEDGSPTLMWSLMEAPNSPVKAGRNVITAIAVLMVLFYGVSQMLRGLRMSEGDTVSSIESVFRPLLLTFLGLILAIYIYDILTFLENIGTMLYRGIRDSVMGYGIATVTYERVEETLQGSSDKTLWERFKEVIVAGFLQTTMTSDTWIDVIWGKIQPSIHSWVIKGISRIGLIGTFYAMVAGAYGLLFEMVLRKLFMPIAVSDFVTEGVRSSAIRYLKGYLGVYLRIGMFYVLLQLCMFIEAWAASATNIDSAYEINTLLGPVGVCICSRMAVKALLNATGGFTREILGGEE